VKPFAVSGEGTDRSELPSLRITSVVEESLESGAVPEGRRYVVRRYFQLIRPRFDAKRAP